MTTATRNLLLSLGVVASTLATTRVDAGDSLSVSPTGSRVRPRGPALAAVMQDAANQSPTFRQLVEIIQASDGIVYIEEGRCWHGLRACLVDVTSTRVTRILRIVVVPRAEPLDLMESIGHELRHAIEILSERSVTSTSAMVLFYRRVGRQTSTGAFETEAAIETGHAVRSEVRRHAARARRPPRLPGSRPRQTRPVQRA